MKSRHRSSVSRAALLLAALAVLSCKDDDTNAPVVQTPVLTTIAVAVPASTITLGQTTPATATGKDQTGAAIGVGTVTWSTSSAAVATVNETGMVTGVGAGTAQIIATSSGMSGQTSVTVTAPPAIKFNEVESNGGTPGDWAELYNGTAAPVDLSGWVFKDNDDTHNYTLPAGTTIATGGYIVVEEAQFGFGLGAPDAVRIFNPFGVLVDTYTWTAHATTTYGRCPNITGAFTTTTTSTKGTANDCSIAIKINEVESNGGTPGDWVEFFNAGPSPVDLTGYIFKDNDDTHSYALPAGSIIATGGFLVIEEAQFTFGLGQPDAARLFTPGANPTIVDSYSWDTHAATTYGRCPDGTGALTTTITSTKGTANACTGGTTSFLWPGDDVVTTVDGSNVFQTNLSGLTYEGAAGANPAVLWAVRNGPGTLFRLIFSGGIWTPDPANGWGAGKALKYTDGTGNPDSEGVTFAATNSASGMYVATERNNDASTISRNSILRFDVSQAGSTLTATNDWNITADLPVVGANLGIEAITYIPDAYLTSKNFFDESAGKVYTPADYADHGGGLFFVGLENDGKIYVYALNHTTNGFRRIATISTPNPAIMEVTFDRELTTLWAVCDDGCGGKHYVMDIDVTPASPTLGKFITLRTYDRPASMPNLNNEGFTMVPQAECVNNRKPVFWSDDGETGGHSIRRSTIPCVKLP